MEHLLAKQQRRRLSVSGADTHTLGLHLLAAFALSALFGRGGKHLPDVIRALISIP